jgi:fused signal recognition particle receptor
MGVAPPAGIAVTRGGLWQRITHAIGKNRSAAQAAHEIERILLEADCGVEATETILAALAQRSGGGPPDEGALEGIAAAMLTGTADPPPDQLARATEPPTVVLMFGVNGVGKTTTAAKLAHRLGRQGRRVLLAAADTFRAGAATQLRRWADRLQVPCVSASADGTGDPAAVAFDAIDAAAARGCDTVLVDTAGRLHTEARLLDELKKVVRVVGKRRPGAPHESLLVLDGTVGQNAVSQAREFQAAVPLTGLIITKLDGTARGGAVLAVRRAVPVPIRYLGTGEGLEDLEPFDAARYAHRLVHG